MLPYFVSRLVDRAAGTDGGRKAEVLDAVLEALRSGDCALTGVCARFPRASADDIWEIWASHQVDETERWIAEGNRKAA